MNVYSQYFEIKLSGYVEKLLSPSDKTFHISQLRLRKCRFNILRVFPLTLMYFISENPRGESWSNSFTRYGRLVYLCNVLCLFKWEILGEQADWSYDPITYFNIITSRYSETLLIESTSEDKITVCRKLLSKLIENQYTMKLCLCKAIESLRGNIWLQILRKTPFEELVHRNSIIN